VSQAANLSRFSVRETFASLRYPNYRLWFIGQMVSLVGTWMQSTAQGYLIYELTRSPAYLGYVSFVGGIPTWIFTLYAGAIADRIPRRTLLVIAQTAMMMLAFILAVLVFTGVVQPWHILVLSFLLGICNSFDAPARQAFILELVDRDVMTNAIALNATMFNSAVVVGPAVGGLAYAAFGPGWCFTLNGISFISVIIALVLMKLNPVARLTRKATAMSDIKEGLKYTLSNPTLVMLISNLSVTTIFGIGVATLIPAWAVNVLGGDAATNGFLVSARGLGALIGALMIASAGRARGRGRTWTYASIVLPLVMFFFVFVRWMPLVLLGMAGVGWGFVSLNNTTNAMVQSQVEDEIRGRVMGIYMLVFFGSMPLGSLIMGEMATLVGEPLTVLISAAILLIFALLVIWRRPEMRRLE
jgi:MFS family permease